MTDTNSQISATLVFSSNIERIVALIVNMKIVNSKIKTYRILELAAYLFDKWQHFIETVDQLVWIEICHSK